LMFGVFPIELVPVPGKFAFIKSGKSTGDKF
jgi:hypothetical protein